jgi:hypothetical protein
MPGTVVLPDQQEMMWRLRVVCDLPHYVNYLYPQMIELAGREMEGVALAVELLLAVDDFVDLFNDDLKLVVRYQVLIDLRQYIETLVDDADVKSDAFRLLDTANAFGGLAGLNRKESP